MDGAAGGAGFRLRGEHPVHLGIVDELEDAGGDVDPGQGVLGAGFEQDDAGAGFDEPGGDDAAGGAGAHHDVVCVHFPLPAGVGAGSGRA